MASTHMTLDDRLTRKLFLEKLEQCELHPENLYDSEYKFIEDMRRLFTNREDDMKYGAPIWNPTVKQYNYLTMLWHKVLAR